MTPASRGYKIISLIDGQPKFMFCALHGSRNLELGVWLTAERKPVTDGSGAEYDSGFHVLSQDLYVAKKYVTRFKNKSGKFLVEVLYRDSRRKPTKGSLATLAMELFIPEASVDSAIELTQL